MKSIILILLPIVFMGCFGKPPIVKTGLEGKPIPSFDLLLQDSVSHFNTEMIPSGKPFILYSFATWCPYCKAQTEELISEIKDFKNINIYMITTSTLSELRAFSVYFKLPQYKNIVAGIDTKFYFAGYFKTNIVPYFALYDKDKKLKQVLAGKSSVISIIETLEDPK